jgi:hypothetical protein
MSRSISCTAFHTSFLLWTELTESFLQGFYCLQPDDPDNPCSSPAVCYSPSDALYCEAPGLPPEDCIPREGNGDNGHLLLTHDAKNISRVDQIGPRDS